MKFFDKRQEGKMQVNVEEKGAYKLKFSQKLYFFLKSIADFLIALVALIVLSPLFLVVAIAIKVDSKGPVFFVQKRIGKGGKLFSCVKFRSMSVEARHDVAGYEYAEVKSYITKVGAFLRKTSIDELPQLYNVLTFKMSLIGYRPSQNNETELMEAREQYGVYQVRPGITGWAQVNGRDVLAAQPKKKAEFDGYYVKHCSLWLDIKILFKTVAVVFKSDGIEEGVIVQAEESAAEQQVEQEVAVAETEIEQEPAVAQEEK
jgi:O-antigen biosynthesis protein WbqP